MSLSFTNSPSEIAVLLRQIDLPLHLERTGDGARCRLTADTPRSLDTLVGIVPAITQRELGSAAFQALFGLTKSYVGGAMAGAIASEALCVAASRVGGMAIFGAGGLSIEAIDAAMRALRAELGDRAFGCNLLHAPHDPGHELLVAERCLAHQVCALEAAAFLKVTPAVVLFRARGLKTLPSGEIAGARHVFAKVSRPEVAAQFLKPPPATTLRELVAAQKLSEAEAALAAHLPVATAITAEADSGGHTDQRPLSVLLPLVLAERDRAREKNGWREASVPIFVGAGGGLGDPNSFLAALALGADYLVTGSLNQSCVEAGTSGMVKSLLCKAGMADMAMAPSADLFEAGGRVQVLKRGTLFAQRAQRLLDAWKSADAFEALPQAERARIEADILQQPFEELWEGTLRYWQARNPALAEKALLDGKTRMALTFRAYLGQSSRWARDGIEDRKSDFQIWCGPAIGAFNEWVSGTWLAPAEARAFGPVLDALFHASAALTRRQILQGMGGEALPSMREVGRPAEREALAHGRVVRPIAEP
ncbi:MAG: PfaD family polyunsaturated fatty acid/polyketide biosynthesis protein [Myxococcales bacterium]|jgi:PfaD family protein|nr:PfaD family polyunsaturated fatty acid/polyketide biosynthesis protein [Myxococcales bacterium]